MTSSLGSRILAQNAVAGGMPRYKYVANRALTFVENLMVESEAVGVPHGPSRIQQGTARGDSLREEFRGLRIRQPGDRSSSRGRSANR